MIPALRGCSLLRNGMLRLLQAIMYIIRSFTRLIGLGLVAGFIFVKPTLLVNLRNDVNPWGHQAALNMQTDGNHRALLAVYDPDQRPYTPASPWNTPIGESPIY